MTKSETHATAKAEVIKKIDYHVMKMREHCRRNKLDNAQIAKTKGLHTPMVWRFINRTSPEMTMVNFFLVAEAIGYEITIKLKDV